jgi:hypothetical protein
MKQYNEGTSRIGADLVAGSGYITLAFNSDWVKGGTGIKGILYDLPLDLFPKANDVDYTCFGLQLHPSDIVSINGLSSITQYSNRFATTDYVVDFKLESVTITEADVSIDGSSPISTAFYKRGSL